MRFAVLLFAVLLVASAAQAQPAVGLIQCPHPGCVQIEGEFLLTTAILTRQYFNGAPSPGQTAIGQFSGITFGLGPNGFTDWSVDRNGSFAASWLDGKDFDYGVSTSGGLPVPLERWVRYSGDSQGNEELLTTGQFGPYDVHSEVTPLNGVDLAGMDMHVVRLAISSGDYRSVGGTTEIDIKLELFGAPGAVPEPSTVALLLIGLCALIPRPARRC